MNSVGVLDDKLGRHEGRERVLGEVLIHIRNTAIKFTDLQIERTVATFNSSRGYLLCGNDATNSAVLSRSVVRVH